MLSELSIKNVALIDQINIEFDNGLNILTGETGAGKSIIIDSINAILGSRTSKEIIRTGTDKAEVQAVFVNIGDSVLQFMEEIGVEPEEDGTLIISRQIADSGKNSCRINGSIVTVSSLKELGQRLIDVHGQHDNQSLLRVETHIELLDTFAGGELEKIKKAYTEKLEKYNDIQKKLIKLKGIGEQRDREIDLLKFQIEEIEKASLKPGDDTELEMQYEVLSNAERIKIVLMQAYEEAVIGSEGAGVIDRLTNISTELKAISKYNADYERFDQTVTEAIFSLEDVMRDIRKAGESLEYDEYALEEAQQRLNIINSLKRKYGSTIEEILNHYDFQRSKLEEIINNQEYIDMYTKQLAGLKNELLSLAQKLNALRLKAAVIIEENICKQLEELEMKKAKFKVDIKMDTENGFGSMGMDSVEFLISPNVGEALKPLAKIASGGEMSRIMLAIKTLLVNIEGIPTLIFDEIDSGVSGKTAQKVGEKLAMLSRKNQILCVTHHAQIAALAKTHFLIEKNELEKRTKTNVNRLEKQGREREIARLLSGENITDNTLRLAKEMLN